MAEQDAVSRAGQSTAYDIGAVVGAVFVGLLCGLLPYSIAKRRGKPKLAYCALASCVLAGLVANYLLALPTAIAFTAVALVLPSGRRARIVQSGRRSQGRNAGMILGAVFLLVAVGIAALVLYRSVNSPSTETTIEAALKRLADEQNRGLPKQIDSWTRWDRVDAGPGRNLHFVYTLSANLTADQKRALEEAVARNVSALPEMKLFLRDGVTLWYRCLDSAGNTVHEFTVPSKSAPRPMVAGKVAPAPSAPAPGTSPNASSVASVPVDRSAPMDFSDLNRPPKEAEKRKSSELRRTEETARTSGPAEVAAAREFRAWRDATGRFEIEAQLVSVTDGEVRLRKRNGQEVATRLDRLSRSDQEFVARAALTAPSLSGEPRAAAAARQSAPFPAAVGRPLNLLVQVDVSPGKSRGAWQREGTSLLSSDGGPDMIQIPCALPEEYSLTIVAEPLAGRGGLNFGIVVGSHAAMVALDGWGIKANGLHLLDGRIGSQNETTKIAQVFAARRPTTIVCTVRKARVQVSCDGNPLIDWSGDPARLSRDESFWPSAIADKLFLGTWMTSYRFTKIELVPLGPRMSGEE